MQLTVEHLRGLKYGAEHTRGERRDIWLTVKFLSGVLIILLEATYISFCGFYSFSGSAQAKMKT